MKYYAGIGSRKTPSPILKICTQIAEKLSESHILRSGGAFGADRAFELGTNNHDIFLADDATDKAIELASQFHPAWDNCKPYVRALHGRNSMQILGKDLDQHVSFVICWTPDGCESHKTRSFETGGTGTAISIANHFEIPIFNLKNKKAYDRIMTWLTGDSCEKH